MKKPNKNPFIFDPKTDKVEWRNPTPIAELERRAKLYLGETDTAQFIWSNRTHRTASEAFRDADYATPMWRCESDFQQGLRFLVGMAQGMLTVMLVVLVPVLVVMWVVK